MVYVALLRGINVGGNSKMEMPKLKSLFESLGCSDVITYINSGNVVFRDNRSSKVLVQLIEKAILDKFKLEIRIVIRDRANIEKLCKEIPEEWTNDTSQKTDVMFLWEEMDNSDVLTKVIQNPKIEKIRYIAGAIIWNIGRQNVAKGYGVKLIKTDLYKHVTVRNINTVRKLHMLMDDVAT